MESSVFYIASDTKKSIGEDLKAQSFGIIAELGIYLVTKKTLSLDRNRRKIYDGLHRIPTVEKYFKIGNKYPSARFIYNHTYRIWMQSGAYSRYLRDFFSSAGENYDPDYLEYTEVIAREYFLWLSGKLSTSGRVTKSEVYDVLEELRKVYRFMFCLNLED